MLDLITAFQSEVGQLPLWVQIWMKFMEFILILSIPFSFVRVEARWILLGLIGAALTIIGLYATFGFEKILGLGHIVTFLPVAIYLYRRRSQWHISETWAGKWIALAFTVMSISLVFDIIDVSRWLLTG